MAKQVVVDIVGDAGKFNGTLSASTTSVAKFGVVAGIGGKVASVGFDLVTSAISGVVGGLGDAQSSYREDQASQASLGRALDGANVKRGLTIDAIEDQISANQALGVSDSVQREGIRDFIDLTGSDTEAMKLNAAAVELAAAKGITYEEAQAKIKSAVNGKTAALAKDGVEVEKGADATAIATAILDKYSGSAETMAATSEGRVAVSQEKVGEAMEKVGGIVDRISQVALPLLADAMTFIVDNVVPLLAGAFDWLSTNVLPVLQGAFNFISTTVLPALQTAFTFITTNVLPPLSKAFSDIAKVVLPVLQGAMNFIANTVLPALRVAFDVITKQVIPPLSTVLGTLISIGITPTKIAIQFITSTVLPALGTAFDFITKNVIPPLSKAFDTVVKTVLPPIRTAIEFLTKTVIPALSTAFTGIQTTVSRVFGAVSGVIKGALNTVIGVVNAMIRGINRIQVHIGRIGLDVPGVGFVGVGPFDWNGLNLGTLPMLHAGGVVPGPSGADVLAVLQAGERVIPRGMASGGPVIAVQITNFYGTDADIDRLTDRIAMRLRLAGG
jgi:hypothetical protein